MKTLKYVSSRCLLLKHIVEHTDISANTLRKGMSILIVTRWTGIPSMENWHKGLWDKRFLNCFALIKLSSKKLQFPVNLEIKSHKIAHFQHHEHAQRVIIIILSLLGGEAPPNATAPHLAVNVHYCFMALAMQLNLYIAHLQSSPNQVLLRQNCIWVFIVS